MNQREREGTSGNERERAGTADNAERQTPNAARRKLLFRVIRITLRTGLAILFLFAATTKLIDPAEFAQQIANYQLVPWPVAAILAVFLPALEFCLGFSLLLGRLETGALIWAAILLIVFTGALVLAIARGLSIDCGCFGRSIENTGTVGPLIRNLALLVITGLLWFSRKNSRIQTANESSLSLLGRNRSSGLRS
jgi:putative oxidoreductase